MQTLQELLDLPGIAAEEHALGDLDLEAAGWKACLGQGLADDAVEIAGRELRGAATLMAIRPTWIPASAQLRACCGAIAEHEPPMGTTRPGLLGQLQELAGQHQAALRMLANATSASKLGAGRPGEIEDRLVEDGELGSVERPPHIDLESGDRSIWTRIMASKWWKSPRPDCFAR